MYDSETFMMLGEIALTIALVGFVGVILVIISYCLSAAIPTKKVYRNKDSVWTCQHCHLRYKKDIQIIWTWKNVANRGTPICEACDSDMDLDVEATENR